MRHAPSTHHSTDEISKLIDADSLVFLPMESLGLLMGRCEYCSTCFDGEYPTSIPQNISKDRFEQKISEKNKTKK